MCACCVCVCMCTCCVCVDSACVYVCVWGRGRGGGSQDVHYHSKLKVVSVHKSEEHKDIIFFSLTSLESCTCTLKETKSTSMYLYFHSFFSVYITVISCKHSCIQALSVVPIGCYCLVATTYTCNYQDFSSQLRSLRVYQENRNLQLQCFLNEKLLPVHIWMYTHTVHTPKPMHTCNTHTHTHTHTHVITIRLHIFYTYDLSPFSPRILVAPTLSLSLSLRGGKGGGT